ncbi:MULTISPECIES: HRDC domain-containing protein [unclassified Fusibacter]|uniref:HRDC domain-containing protein n=1 Tax=unclassified Fusibacter TaxID=2624464 RepID=UPI001FA9F501|nr:MULTISPECIES: HRDC domain-containing protein [unclassified Fusibacter]MCK8058397.1 HRDC domain-containing protein [Fusibacter sp. A2]
MIGRYFEHLYKPIVVLANPKTVLNAKFAKKATKNQVIRADQLVKYIKDQENQCKEPANSDAQLQAWAERFLTAHIDKEHDYTKKFSKYLIDQNIEITAVAKVDEPELSDILSTDMPKFEDESLIKDMKKFRLERSRSEKIKPYFIYNDKQLTELIEKMPVTFEALKSVNGFGDVKVNKYGDEIIEIIQKHLVRYRF